VEAAAAAKTRALLGPVLTMSLPRINLSKPPASIEMLLILGLHVNIQNEALHCIYYSLYLMVVDLNFKQLNTGFLNEGFSFL
jgi:hypothetical protein